MSASGRRLNPLVIDHVSRMMKQGEPPRLQYVLHRFISKEDEPALIDFFQQLVEQVASSSDASFVVEFCFSLICGAWPFSLDSLLDLKILFRTLKSKVKLETADALVNEVERQIHFKSPVLGRWFSDPCKDMLGWMIWSDLEIANGLTNICEPFSRLRAWEFESNPGGPHLQHLNNLANSLSYFVTTSILVGCLVSLGDGVNVVVRWLAVMDHLLELGNFHLLHSTFMGLSKHQVDRLSFVWKTLPTKASKTKALMDALFDPSDRFARVIKLWTDRCGKKPTIKSIFWMMQKATLFQESPLVFEGAINPSALLASENIYGNLFKMQQVPYPKLECPEEVDWMFLQLHRCMGMDDTETIDEKLYGISHYLMDAKNSLKPSKNSWGDKGLNQSKFISLDVAVACANSNVSCSAEPASGI